MSQRPQRKLLDESSLESETGEPNPDINVSLSTSTRSIPLSPSVRRSSRLQNSPAVNYKDTLR